MTKRLAVTTITIIIGILFLLISIPAWSQTWYPANQKTVAWDAVTVPSGTVTYKLYSQPESGGTPTLMTTVATTQATVTFTVEGRYYLGVSTVRTVSGVEVESSTISWSNNPAVCAGGATFGIQYLVAPNAPTGFRTVP